MIDLLSLLGVGYFPRELPPVFSSRRYGDVITTNLASLPSSFFNGSLTAKLEMFRLNQVGRIPRRLNIPNPIPYFRLCQEIVANWDQFQRHTHRSSLSQSKPEIGPQLGASRRAIVPQTFQQGQLLRVKSRSKARYLVLADVSQCYSSFYTHSIPWALNTKPTAKNRRHDSTLLGNSLDTCMRKCQDDQTKGIPIGPDTSFLVSEIILSAVDCQLGPMQGFRYFDNYELCFSTRLEADTALNELEQALAEYELFLNPDKTAVVQLPVPFVPTWVSDLGNYPIREDTMSQQFNDLITYFSLAFEFARQYPTDPILRFAIYRTDSVSIHAENWELYQALLFQSVMSDPGTLPYVAEKLLQAKSVNRPIDKTTLEDVLNAQFDSQNLLKNESDVAWAIWAALTFRVPIQSRAARILSSVNNSMVALLALDAQQKGIIAPNELDLANWESYMKKTELYGEHWLLAYEANVQGWLSSSSAGDHVASDECFGYLKQMGVKFYNTSPVSYFSVAKLVPAPFNLYFLLPWS